MIPNPINPSWMDKLREMTDTPQEQILFLLGLILGAMLLDFVLGSLGARLNPNIEFRSKEGINGIIRKLASIALLAYCIPLSAVLPETIGTSTLLVLYFGYLVFELKSILENLDKLGINSDLFKSFIDNFSSITSEGKKDDKEEDDDNSKRSH